MKIGTLGCCLAVALLTSGCASVGGFIPPDVTLVNVEFTDLTLFESSGRLTVRVANENDMPLALDGGVYNLYFGGTKIGKGLSDEKFEVGRLSSETAEFDVYINNLALATRIKQMIDEGIVDYRLRGKLFLDRSVRRRTLRFDYAGSYDFRQARPSPEVQPDPAARPTPDH